MQKIFIMIFLVLGIIASGFAGSAGPAIDFTTFFSVYRIGTPTVSASGKFIVFTVKKALLAENKYETQIWCVNQDGSGLKQLTTNAASSTSPQVGVDDTYLYFIAKRGETGQLWRLPLAGGEAQPVTDVYGDISGFMLSADNKSVLLQRMVNPECRDEDCLKRIAQQKKDSQVKARIIDHLMFRHWSSWLEGQFSHVFIYNIDKKSLLDLTPGDYHTPPVALGSSHDYCFSPDGQEVCFVSNHDPEIAISTNNDIFILPLAQKEPSKISSSQGNDNNPQYSADGNYIAYSSMERAGFESDRDRLMLYNRRTGQTAELTANFKLSVGEILWSPDCKEIFFTAEEADNISIYSVNIKSQQIVPVLKGHYVQGIQFLNKDELVFAQQSARYPVEIFKYNLNSKKITQLTFFNTENLARFDLPSYEEFWFTGALGDSIQGFIMKPPGFTAGKKYPAVHLIHGGPQGAWNNNFHFRWNYQMFAAPGYVVYWINFHGSKGYGQKFTDIISGHWGDYPYEDLVRGTEYVLNHYDYVDGNRLAAAGASYGGFMVNWIAGHDNPYKCLVSHDGTYEQVSMYGSTEELWFPEWEFGGVPWGENTTYEQWSPSRLAANFKTPMLIIHSEQDFRVPYTQGLQIFTALQRQGVPSRLLFFPDEDHFVQKPQNAQLWWQTVYEWLGRYLK
jgi:dipeptidyl aminopeptidase/acylaminoacyl peptidase